METQINLDIQAKDGSFTPSKIAAQGTFVFPSVEITATDKGFLLPRLTTTERDNIVAPVAGSEIYNTTTNQPEIYNGTMWTTMGGGGGSASGPAGAVQLSNGSGSFTNDPMLAWRDVDNTLRLGVDTEGVALSITATSGGYLYWADEAVTSSYQRIVGGAIGEFLIRQQLSGQQVHVQADSGVILLDAAGSQWTFDTAGKLTSPSYFASSNNATYEFDARADGYLYFNLRGKDGGAGAYIGFSNEDDTVSYNQILSVGPAGDLYIMTIGDGTGVVRIRQDKNGVNGGPRDWLFDANAILTTPGQIHTPNGGVDSPAYSFTSHPGAGLWMNVDSPSLYASGAYNRAANTGSAGGIIIGAGQSTSGADEGIFLFAGYDGTGTGSYILLNTNAVDRLKIDEFGAWQLNGDAGTAGYNLTSQGAGAAPTWTPAGSASVAGSNTQIQYNNSGAFGASPDFTWDNTLKTLTINAAASATTTRLKIHSTISGTSPVLEFASDEGGEVSFLSANESSVWGQIDSGPVGLTVNSRVGPVTLTAINSLNWVFGTDGKLNLPNGPTFVDSGVNVDSGPFIILNTGYDFRFTGAGALSYPTSTQAQIDGMVDVVEGMLIWNGDTNLFNFYNGTEWVVLSSVSFFDNLFTYSGSNIFTLTQAPVPNAEVVAQNGLVLRPTTDYTISGTTLTILTALVTGDSIQAKYGSSAGGGGGTPGGSNTQVQFNNSGVFGGSANLTWNGSDFAIVGDLQITAGTLFGQIGGTAFGDGLALNSDSFPGVAMQNSAGNAGWGMTVFQNIGGPDGKLIFQSRGNGSALILDNEGDGTSSTFVNGAFGLNYRTISSTATAANETNIFADASGGSFTITLPPAAVNGGGRMYTIKKIDSSANTVTIDGDGSETIDGNLTYSINTQWDSVSLTNDSTQWFII